MLSLQRSGGSATYVSPPWFARPLPVNMRHHHQQQQQQLLTQDDDQMEASFYDDHQHLATSMATPTSSFRDRYPPTYKKQQQRFSGSSINLSSNLVPTSAASPSSTGSSSGDEDELNLPAGVLTAVLPYKSLPFRKDIGIGYLLQLTNSQSLSNIYRIETLVET